MTLALILLGDMDCDGALTALDIDGFVMSIADPERFERESTGCELIHGDINDDGVVNGFDIDGFVELLNGG